MSSSKRNKKDKKKKNQQQESAIANGISTENQNVPVENLNTENGKSSEQTIPEARIQKSNSNDKQQKGNKKEKTKSKGPVKKKQKKASLFSIKRLILLYIFAVFFWCNGKTREQCNSYEEAFCFNGISQYILNNDFFHKYIEPAIIMTKLDVFGKQALNKVSTQYETHAKPIINPLLESAQPHLQTARELSVEYVYNPVAESLTKAQEYYNDNARERVDNYYNQAVKFSTPYVSQAQEHASYVYEQASKYNENTVQPWYYKSVVPFKDKVIFYYDTKVVPFAHHVLELIKKIYHETIVPTYHNHVEPHILTILKFIQGDKSKTEKEIKADAERKAKEESDKKAKAEAERKAKIEAYKKAKAEAERKAKEEADRKAKAEAERKAKAEAERIAKAEAERKAKEEAERKAKEEAERKAKEEAERKAKEEAERKAKEDADRKAKEEADRKAKEEADRKTKAEAERKAEEAANKAVRNAFDKEFPLVEKNLTLALENYEKKATSLAQETLHEVEDRIAILKKSGSEYLLNLKEFVEKIKKDSSKDRNTKFNEIKDLAKKFIDNIKESSQNFIEISKKSLNNIEEEKFDELKNEFSLNLVTQIYATKKYIYDQANDIKVDDKLHDVIETATNDIVRKLNENKNSASLRVRKIFTIINDKIGLLTSIKYDVVTDIHSFVKTEKENLKGEASENVKNEKVVNKNTDAKIVESDFVQDVHKDDSQIPVQVEEKSTTEEKASNITVQASSDIILEKLKARQDPVLDTLKKGYELFKAEKGNEPTVQVQPVEDDGNYEDEEEYESDECSSDDQ